ncbi:MAG TPA: hypothetical protein VHV77_05075, partial [Pirellulales bacterium]|nr:hypothetical protein [Pirellulales bacterium]
MSASIVDQMAIDKIADAVLYEGYILYPYRPSTKNRQRWTFGGVYPRDWCETAKCGDRASIATQCLVIGDSGARVSARLRFLHLMSRDVRRLDEPLADLSTLDASAGQSVDCLRIGEQSWYTWQEAADKCVDIESVSLADLAIAPVRRDFQLAESQSVERLLDANGRVVGLLVRRQEAVAGTIELSAEHVGNDV